MSLFNAGLWWQGIPHWVLKNIWHQFWHLVKWWWNVLLLIWNLHSNQLGLFCHILRICLSSNGLDQEVLLPYGLYGPLECWKGRFSRKSTFKLHFYMTVNPNQITNISKWTLGWICHFRPQMDFLKRFSHHMDLINLLSKSIGVLERQI